MNIAIATGPANALDSAAGRQQNHRLVGAAHEFEASMLAELLKPLQQTAAVDDKEADEGSCGALISYSTQALGKALSEHGGIGIAREVLAHLGAKKVI